MATKPAKNQNNLNRLLNRYFPAVIAVALLFFLLLCYLFLIGPKMARTEEAIRANLEQQQNIYTIGRRKLANLTALNNVYAKIGEADLQKFNAVLPDNYPAEKLFGEIEETVARGGWLLNSVTVFGEEDRLEREASGDAAGEPIVVPGSTNENLGRIDLDLSVGAIDYKGFKSLVRMLETNLRLFDITKVEFSPAAGQADITLTTYYYKQAN